MKTSFRLKTVFALPFLLAALAAFSGCGGDNSGGGTSSGTTNYTFDTTNGDPLVNIGGGEYLDPNTGDVLNNVGGNTFVNTTNGDINYGMSKTEQTKDVDLQKADVQTANQNARAQVIANQFEMSTQASLQLVELADKVKQMTRQGQMTVQDREAVTRAGLSIAGVSPDQVNDAINRSMNGDTSAADALLDKAAQNLGMTSSAALRDKLLPALGYKVN